MKMNELWHASVGREFKGPTTDKNKIEETVNFILDNYFASFLDGFEKGEPTLKDALKTLDRWMVNIYNEPSNSGDMEYARSYLRKVYEFRWELNTKKRKLNPAVSRFAGQMQDKDYTTKKGYGPKVDTSPMSRMRHSAIGEEEYYDIMNELWHAGVGRKLYDFTYDELKARVPKIAKIIDDDAALVARGDSPGTHADISEVIKCINDEYDSEIKKWRQYKIASNKDIEPLISELNSDREKMLTKYKALVSKNRINYSYDSNALGIYKRIRHSAFDGALYHSFEGVMYGVKTK